MILIRWKMLKFTESKREGWGKEEFRRLKQWYNGLCRGRQVL